MRRARKSTTWPFTTSSKSSSPIRELEFGSILARLVGFGRSAGPLKIYISCSLDRDYLVAALIYVDFGPVRARVVGAALWGRETGH